MEPNTPSLDELAERLAELPEAERQAVVAKAASKDTANRKKVAAAALSRYLGGTRTRS
jgi:hypothetical protein